MPNISIVNKVAEGGIISFDLESLYPKDDIVIFDIKGFLFMEMIIKEKEFRAALLEQDWTLYKNKNVAITCTADAIIPLWAYMLIAHYLQPVAIFVVFGNKEKLIEQYLLQAIDHIDVTAYADKRIVVKGCGKIAIPESAFVAITCKLLPVVKSIMYGEPCSTVPIYKKK